MLKHIFNKSLSNHCQVLEEPEGRYTKKNLKINYNTEFSFKTNFMDNNEDAILAQWHIY